MDYMECSSSFIVDQINVDYTLKMIITNIQKRFRVVISYKKDYHTWKIILNEVHADFNQSYAYIILFLRELKLCDSCPNISFIKKLFSKNILGFQSLL